jgi:hypothetical protein
LSIKNVQAKLLQMTSHFPQAKYRERTDVPCHVDARHREKFVDENQMHPCSKKSFEACEVFGSREVPRSHDRNESPYDNIAHAGRVEEFKEMANVTTAGKNHRTLVYCSEPRDRGLGSSWVKGYVLDCSSHRLQNH